MAQNPPRTWSIVERTLPWIVLAILCFFTYSTFFLIPYAGFEIANGKVTGLYVDRAGSESLQIGDQLLRVGAVEWEAFEKDLRLAFFDGVIPGQKVRLIIHRNGEELAIDWIYPGPGRKEALERLNSQWWISYVFWLAGTATSLFIRPKNTLWLLLTGLNYLTAVWLAAGTGPSHWHVAESAIVLRSAVWLSIPVYLHFHWIFPRPLARIPPPVMGSLYLSAFGLAVLEWFQILPTQAYFTGLLLSLAGSVLLLLAHLTFQPAYRREILQVALGTLLIFVPPLGVSLAFLLGAQPSGFIQGGSVLALPALPGAYFFAVYRRQFDRQERQTKRLVSFYLSAIVFGALFILLFSLLDSRFTLERSTLAIGIASTILVGIIATISFFPFLALPALAGEVRLQTRHPAPLELRANRLVSSYLFVVLVGVVLTVTILVADAQLNFPGKAVLIGVFAAILGVSLTMAGLFPFQRLIERHLLFMPLSPTHLVETYAARITTSLDVNKLSQLLRDEILPSVLVRQSAVLYLEEGSVSRLFEIGVEEYQLPAPEQIDALLAHSDHRQHPSPDDLDPDPYAWIRLVLPLKVNEVLMGVWLLGKRDPDNLYTPDDVSMLQTIANQTAIALANIAQTKRLRSLYQVNIDREENERKRLAHGLHDEVLNELAALFMDMGELNDRSGLKESIQRVATYLRQVIGDLRPAMLAYGLRPALEELVDDLSERAKNVAIEIDVPESDERYELQVEQHLFRIVQQAVENALRHAHANKITVTGQIARGSISLAVADDGTGFEVGENLDLSDLLSKRHFGLAGMLERASLINARVDIRSQVGRGTRVQIDWRS